MSVLFCFVFVVSFSASRVSVFVGVSKRSSLLAQEYADTRDVWKPCVTKTVCHRHFTWYETLVVAGLGGTLQKLRTTQTKLKRLLYWLYILNDSGPEILPVDTDTLVYQSVAD